MTYWRHVHHKNYIARCMADEHYSRKTIGASEFMPPGEKIVLLGQDEKAVWGIQRISPYRAHEIKRRDGFTCWDNTIFRKTNDLVASDLILEAVAICVGIWADIPSDGLHTFIDPLKVKPVMRRGEKTWGRSYLLAGFEYHSDTQGGLMRFVLSADKMRDIKPVLIPHYKPRLFEMTERGAQVLADIG